jgi:hypothetical protein
MNITKLNLLRL